MRALSLHPEVILLTSRIWQTNCVLLRGGEECFLLDSPILPDELQALPALLEQSGVGLSGLLVTHADWDHLLGRLAFPQAPLGCAETTAARMRSAPGEPQRELRSFDEEYYLQRERPLTLGSVQALPVPGHCEIGPYELDLHPTDGHTCEGMAVHAGWAGVLAVGDYLSEIEIPNFALGGGSLEAYLATLERLRALLSDVEHVIPGHGPVLSCERALAVLERDRAYLEDLKRRGEGAQLPARLRTRAQHELHMANLAAL